MLSLDDQKWMRSLLTRAGQDAMARQATILTEHKHDGSPVTEADRASERIIVEELTKRFPGVGIIGEEGTDVSGGSGDYWVIDPIDGTGAYVSGLAYYGPTIALISSGEVVGGALYLPRLDEFRFAAKGHGTWFNDRRARTREPIAGSPVMYPPSQFHRVGPIPFRGKMRVLGSTAAHMALVATGSGQATVVTWWSLWDVAAGALMIQESGGVVWDIYGNDVNVAKIHQGLPILAGAPNHLQSLLVDGWSSKNLARD